MRLANETWPGVELHTLVLPVEFEKSAINLLAAIKSINPKVVISFGQAEGRSAITPEKIAINLDDGRIADNGGDQRQNQPIVKTGADGYFSTLPVEKMVSELTRIGVPSALSLSAGSFVCNHIFYLMQHELRETKIRSGFVHLPLVPEQSAQFPNQPTMSLDEMVRGAKSVILSTL